MTSGPRLLGPRLLKTGPRLLDTAAGPRLLGPRLLKAGPRLLGPRLLKTQTRQLHMTGPATFPSRFLTPETSFASPGEGKQAKTERPSASTFSAEPKQTRHFNTSRTLKASGDTSTIDFAFLPDQTVLAYGNSMPDQIRVPILPLAFFPPRTDWDNNHGELDIPVHRPIISTASADITHVSSPSAVSSDLSQADHHADFHGVEDQVAGILKGVAEKAGMQGKEQEEVLAKAQGLLKQVWKGLMDDVFGNKAPKA